MQKSIEIYYNIDDVPGIDSSDQNCLAALEFRNDAMMAIENALEAAQAGEWVGAEIGMGEVNFGFYVHDFEQAEGIVRAAVKGTPWAHIREIERREIEFDA